MYIQDIWRFENTIEHEIKYAGKFGNRGEKRAQKIKATPEQIKKQNQKNKEKRMRRLIEANFHEYDFWITLKYPKGLRKPTSEVEKDIKKFIETLRRKYKAQSQELKYIYRLEIGKQGGIHIHMVVNRIRGSDLLIEKAWKSGRVYFTSLDDGDYTELASYITKPPDEEIEKRLNELPKEERKKYVKYSCSRNLTRPMPERKEYKRRTLRKMLIEGIKPTPGFYIVKESVVHGVNPFTGMSYLHYRERRCVESG